MLPHVPSHPVPMPAAFSPPVAVTEPPLMEIFPHRASEGVMRARALRQAFPVPMPAAHLPPRAVTSPPSILMSPHEENPPAPMPGDPMPRSFLSYIKSLWRTKTSSMSTVEPVASIVPPLIRMLPQRQTTPPPMPGPHEPPLAVIFPPLMVMSPQEVHLNHGKVPSSKPPPPMPAPSLLPSATICPPLMTMFPESRPSPPPMPAAQ